MPQEKEIGAKIHRTQQLEHGGSEEILKNASGNISEFPEPNSELFSDQKELQYLGSTKFDEVDKLGQTEGVSAFEVPTTEQAQKSIPPEVALAKTQEIQETLLSFLNGDNSADLHDMQELGLGVSQTPDNL